MATREVLLYFAWSRPAEAGAPLAVIDDRFPALFESRRMLYPKFRAYSDPERFDQGIAGFLDHIQKPNFAEFVEQAQQQTGRHVVQIERVTDSGELVALDHTILDTVDTVIIISFDSLRTEQRPSLDEVDAVRRFLDRRNHLLFICPHHEIGAVFDLPSDAGLARQLAEHLHHGDRTIPSRQGFGGFARALLSALEIPVENRFGLRPLLLADGSPAPIEIERTHDDWQLLDGVETFNVHPHLPHFERLGDAASKLQVLARQKIDPAAPPHEFTKDGRTDFDALLQSAPGVFNGRVCICDATIWSSTAGGAESLRRLWSNVLERVETNAKRLP